MNGLERDHTMAYISGYIFLRISGENLDFNEISKMLNILPKISYKKGDKRILSNFEEVVYTEDCWLIEYRIPKKTEILKAIQKFLGRFNNKRDYLRNISKKYMITLWISVYPDDIQINFNIPHNTIQIISEMGIDIDISITYLQDFYLEKNQTKEQSPSQLDNRV